MNGHLSAERIHDLLDGALPAAEAEASDTHLEACPICREEHARLAEVVDALGQVPREARAPEGLWADIASRTRGTTPGAEEAEVLAFPGGGGGPRRVSFTVPQLAAAAVIVSLLSAGTVWMAMAGASRGRTGSTPAVSTAPLMARGPAARAASSGVAAYDQAVLELQTIVDDGRAYLAPETLAALDQSLRTIDVALDEIRQALAADPGNELLARMLVRQQTSKLRVLRQAATVVQGQS